MKVFDALRCRVVLTPTILPRGHDWRWRDWRFNQRRALHELDASLDLFARGLPLVNRAIKLLDAFLGAFGTFHVLAAQQRARTLNHERAVHEKEGLLRHRGVEPLRNVEVGIGEV